MFNKYVWGILTRTNVLFLKSVFSCLHLNNMYKKCIPTAVSRKYQQDITTSATITATIYSQTCSGYPRVAHREENTAVV